MTGLNAGDRFSESGRPRVLVLRGGAAGDFFLTLPALAALRRHWSNAFIEVVGHAGAASVAVAAGLIDRASALDAADTARLFAVGSELPEHQRSSIRGFDIIVSYLHDPDGVVAAKLKRQGVRRLVVGSPIVKDTHAAAHLVKPLAELGIERDPSPLRLTLKPAHLERGRRRAAGIGPRVLAVHPGSGSPKKNWPVAKFMDLAGRACGELGLMPMFTVGEADADVEAALTERKCRFPVLAGCSLLEVAEVLSACVAYVGNDSGVTHLAAALGVPVVTLFGPTDPALWGPVGPKVRILTASAKSSESLAAIAAEEVLKELAALQ